MISPMPVNLSVSVSVCLRVCVSVCLRVCVSVCLRVCVSACLRVCVSACLCVCYNREHRSYISEKKIIKMSFVHFYIVKIVLYDLDLLSEDKQLETLISRKWLELA